MGNHSVRTTKAYGPLLPEYCPREEAWTPPLVWKESARYLEENPVPYHIPPDDYVPPTRCLTCNGHVVFGPVMGGHIWMHLSGGDAQSPSVSGHSAEVGVWWDTQTGQWRQGSGLEEVLARATEVPPILGATP